MPAKYEFTVKTGDEAGAGTDSNIFVILHGERPGEKGRQLIEKWAERRKQLQIDLGDTSLPDVHAVVEKRFVGLANPATGELLMRVDSSAPVTLASSPQLMSWSPTS